MEIFDIVDESGQPTGQTVERTRAHAEGILHRTVHIWILRQREGRAQVLLQRRSYSKDSFPGCLDTSSAGHIQAGDQPRESALRELQEELGITASPEDLTFVGNFRVKYEKEFYGKLFRDNEVVFVYMYDRPLDISRLTLQKEEVEEVQWFGLEEVLERIRHRDKEICVPTGGILQLKKFLDREQG